MLPRPARRCLSWLAPLAFALRIFADPPIPGNILDPRSSAEAWNVIRLASANVDRLIAEKRWREIPIQVSFCSPALREIGREPEAAGMQATIDRTLGWSSALATASMEDTAGRVAESREKQRDQLAELAAKFDPKTIGAEIYLCPTHPDFLATDPATRCPRCGAKLIPRRIAYSFLYVKPGAPTVRLAGESDAPLAAGHSATVTIHLQHLDGSPVQLTDLLVVHSASLHLLIADSALNDFQLVHPKATKTPGEYRFTFTPRSSGSHRLWADLVPAETALQELPSIDLPSSEPNTTAIDTAERLEAKVAIPAAGGTFGSGATTDAALNFRIALSTAPLRANQPSGLQLTVTDANGQPFAQLEPIMNSFAHVFGFFDDYETVVHLHPGSGEILMSEARGGPTLRFSCYPPRAGFLRLYCEVQVNGAPMVAAFGLQVAP